ncbi:hypothetical protein Pse7367_3616 [Thalassoporum mexicanum PCC 7367]|nr:hypothetical protein Pse7367_3616 [Pseudanabaena sp. PCC 7367]
MLMHVNDYGKVITTNLDLPSLASISQPSNH